MYAEMGKCWQFLGKTRPSMNEVNESHGPGKHCPWDVFFLVLISRGVVMVASIY